MSVINCGVDRSTLEGCIRITHVLVCITSSSSSSAQDSLAIERQWYVNGVHYSRTLEDWLRRQDRHRTQVLQLFKVRCTAVAAIVELPRPFTAACTLECRPALTHTGGCPHLSLEPVVSFFHEPHYLCQAALASQ